MSVFNKVLNAIQSKPLNGHALRNIQNKRNLEIVKLEIEAILKDSNYEK